MTLQLVSGRASCWQGMCWQASIVSSSRPTPVIGVVRSLPSSAEKQDSYSSAKVCTLHQRLRCALCTIFSQDTCAATQALSAKFDMVV